MALRSEMRESLYRKFEDNPEAALGAASGVQACDVGDLAYRCIRNAIF